MTLTCESCKNVKVFLWCIKGNLFNKQNKMRFYIDYQACPQYKGNNEKKTCRTCQNLKRIARSIAGCFFNENGEIKEYNLSYRPHSRHINKETGMRDFQDWHKAKDCKKRGLYISMNDEEEKCIQ